MGESKGQTRYSEKIAGVRGNHNQSARYDLTGGYLGITQTDGEVVTDRVLLSPKQVEELAKFISRKA